MRTAFLPLLAVLLGATSVRGQAPAWPLLAERMLAADASFHAPPDLKRQIAKHKDRLMAGVSEAAARETFDRSPADHQAAASARAAQIVSSIRQRQPFSDVVFAVGVLIHSVAMAYPPPRASTLEIEEAFRKRSSFLGYSTTPFLARPAVFPPAPVQSSCSAAYDSAVTAGTRLLAWIWNGAGGDASIVTRYPESKGPYVVR